MIKLNFTKISLNYVGKQRIMRKWTNSTGEIRTNMNNLSCLKLWFSFHIGSWYARKISKIFFNKFFIKSFLKKIITKLYNIIFIVLQYSYFLSLWDSWGPRILHLGGLVGEGRSQDPQKPQVGNSTPIFIFDIFKIIGIRNSLYILLIYWLVQNSVNLCFFFNSVWYFWFVARKFSLSS